MTKKNKQLKRTTIFWRFLISAVGIALILIGLSNILLFFFGESVSVQVETRRMGGADNGKPANQRYDWAIDYIFIDKEGKLNNGHSHRRGGDMFVEIENRAFYFPHAPFINSLANEVEPNIGQPILIGLGIFIIYVMNKKKKKKKKKKNKFKVPQTENGERDILGLDDYDDSVEEVFQEED